MKGSPESLIVVSMLLEVAMWGWAAAILLVSPADHYCSLPMFWALMLNANLLRLCEISLYGLGDPFGIIIFVKLVLNGVLVLVAWRVYAGLVVAPVVALTLLLQGKGGREGGRVICPLFPVRPLPCLY